MTSVPRTAAGLLLVLAGAAGATACGGSSSPAASSVSPGSSSSAAASTSISSPPPTAASSPVASSQALPPLPAGAARVSASGFTLALPLGYRQVTDPSKIDAAIGKGASALPQAQSQIRAARAAFARGAKLFAVRVQGGFADNVSVIVTDAGGASPNQITQAAGPAKQSLSQAGAKDIVTMPVALAGGPGLRLTYEIALKTGAKVYGTQEYGVHGSQAYIITLSQGKKIAADATTVFTSFHFS